MASKKEALFNFEFEVRPIEKWLTYGPELYGACNGELGHTDGHGKSIRYFHSICFVAESEGYV